MNPSTARWRKSSRSDHDGECLEVAFVPGRVGVRDTKDRHGALLVFPEPAWHAFTTILRPPIP